MTCAYGKVCGVYLKKDEDVVTIAKTSVAGLIAAWLSAPCFFLLYFIIFYLPSLIRMAVSSAVRNEIMSATGAKAFSDIDIMDYVMGNMFGGLKEFAIGIVTFFAVVIILFWVIASSIMTARHFGYSLAITSSRVIGNAKGQILDAPLDEIINVFIEQSLWGKIFKYGAITVRTKKATLTFKNISSPAEIHKKLMDYANSYLVFYR